MCTWTCTIETQPDSTDTILDNNNIATLYMYCCTNSAQLYYKECSLVQSQSTAVYTITVTQQLL